MELLKQHVSLERLTLALFVCFDFRHLCEAFVMFWAQGNFCRSLQSCEDSELFSKLVAVFSESVINCFILSNSHLVQICAIESDCFAKSQREMSSCQVMESVSGNVWWLLITRFCMLL